VFAKNPHTHSKGKDSGIYGTYKEQQGNWSGDKGRFPANVVHDGSQMVLELFPDTGKSSGGGGVKAPGKNGIYGSYSGHEYPQQLGLGDSGSAARFFYCAKASKKDRGEGNSHPTVKPTELMKWLVKLVTPEGGGGA
jgi:site-specific DNA-methyltransferase (adenine-specific)